MACRRACGGGGGQRPGWQGVWGGPQCAGSPAPAALTRPRCTGARRRAVRKPRWTSWASCASPPGRTLRSGGAAGTTAQAQWGPGEGASPAHSTTHWCFRGVSRDARPKRRVRVAAPRGSEPTHTRSSASRRISSCSLLRMCRLGLFLRANCCSSITLLSEVSCGAEPAGSTGRGLPSHNPPAKLLAAPASAASGVGRVPAPTACQPGMHHAQRHPARVAGTQRGQGDGTRRPRLAQPRGCQRADATLPTHPWGERGVRVPAGCAPPDGSGASWQGRAHFSPAPGPAGRSPRRDRKAAAQPHTAQRLRAPHTPQPRARSSPGMAGVPPAVLTLHTHHSLGTVSEVGGK